MMNENAVAITNENIMVIHNGQLKSHTQQTWQQTATPTNRQAEQIRLIPSTTIGRNHTPKACKSVCVVC